MAGWLAVCLSRYFQPDSPQLTTILLDIRRRNALPMRREGCDGVGRVEGDKTDHHLKGFSSILSSRRILLSSPEFYVILSLRVHRTSVIQSPFATTTKHITTQLLNNDSQIDSVSCPGHVSIKMDGIREQNNNRYLYSIK